MGMTRLRYSRAGMLWLLTSLSTRTARKPTVEQKSICQTVSAMGKGKPLYARSHLLNMMTAMEMPIQSSTTL